MTNQKNRATAASGGVREAARPPPAPSRAGNASGPIEIMHFLARDAESERERGPVRSESFAVELSGAFDFSYPVTLVPQTAASQLKKSLERVLHVG